MTGRTREDAVWGLVGAFSFLVLAQAFEIVTGARFGFGVKFGVAVAVGVAATLLVRAARPALASENGSP